MRFHPDQALPGCMLPDGGDCCSGHQAVCNDWHRQRREIERLRTVLERFAKRVEVHAPSARDDTVVHFRLRDCREARAALDSPEVSARGSNG